MKGNSKSQNRSKNMSNTHIIKALTQQIFDPKVFAQKQDILTRTYAFPASKKAAELHRTAMKFGNPSSFHNDFCPCCLKTINTLQLGLCHRTYPNNICDFSKHQNNSPHSNQRTSNYSFNSGAAMFFFFIKTLIIFLLFHFFVVDLFNILISVNINTNPNKEASEQQSSTWSRFSLQNKFSQPQQIQIVEILSLVMIVISMIFFLIATKIKYYIYHKIDMARQTQDDYAIFVENIPIIGYKLGEKVKEIKVDYDAELQKFFTHKIMDWLTDEDFWVNEEGMPAYAKNTIQHDYVNGLGQIPMDQPPKDIVKSICLCYDIERLQRVDRIRNKLMEEHLTSYKNIQQLKEKQKQRQEKLKKILEESQIENPDQKISDIKRRARRPSVYNSLHEYLQNTRDQRRMEHIPQQIMMCNQSQILVSQEMSTNHAFIHQATHFVGSAFISFKYQHYRDKILEWAQMNYDKRMQNSRKKQLDKYMKEGDKNWCCDRDDNNSHLDDSIRRQSKKENIFSMDFQGNILKISEASHPSEILWKNLSISDSQRKTRRIFSLLLISLVLLFSFLVILSVNVGAGFTKRIVTKIESIFNMSVSIVSALIIMLVNNALSFIIYEVILWERHKTISQAKYSLVKKLLASQFFNSAIIYYLVIKISLYFGIVDPQKDGRQADTVSLLVDQISVLLITSGLSGVFFNFINLPDVWRRLSIWWFYTRKGTSSQLKPNSPNQSASDDSFFPTFQIRLNKQFQYPEFDIASRYSFYLSQVYLASFYGYLIPLAPVIVCITFLLHYWVDKVNLFKRSSLKYEVDHKLTAKMFKLLSKSIVVYACGMLIFSMEINEEPQVFPLIALLISVLYIAISELLPIRLKKTIFESYDSWESFSYDENVKAGKFLNTFWNTNPVTYLLNENNVTKRNRTKNPGITGKNVVRVNVPQGHRPITSNKMMDINLRGNISADLPFIFSQSRLDQIGLSLPESQSRRILRQNSSSNSKSGILMENQAISPVFPHKHNNADVIRGQMITEPDEVLSLRNNYDKQQVSFNSHGQSINPEKSRSRRYNKQQSDNKQKFTNFSKSIGKGKAPY